ncbi:MAG TPA: cytochrome oxidase biogenesis protein Surf12C [Selenomonadales bacterium]|nr:cytochrome oxidase biogenesis protein Surf12C [Selenomonadales bacterium]
MNMTHYMELLAVNQPWNLIIYMVIPVVFAEALVATEFFVVFTRQTDGPLRLLNKWLGIILGFYFLGIFVQLTTMVVPTLEWRGTADILAVGAYLSGVIPLFGIALLELGVIGRGCGAADKMKLHFILLTVFLVVAHIAMIFGMLDPTVMGWQPNAAGTHMMPHSH